MVFAFKFAFLKRKKDHDKIIENDEIDPDDKG